MAENVDRRTLLGLAGTAAVATLAGCSSGGEETTTDTDEDFFVPEPTESKPDGPDAVTTTEIQRDDDFATTITETQATEPQCGEGTIEPDESAGDVSLWHARTMAGDTLLDTTRDRWESATDSTLLLSQIPESNLPVKLQSSIPSGDGPSLFEWPHDSAGEFDEQGLLAAQSGDVDVPDCRIMDTALAASTYDGTQVGVPWAGETVALYYNADLVDSPPESLGEMTRTMEEHDDQDNDQYGLAYPINPYYVSGFAQAYGEEIYDGEADELGLTTDAVVRGLEVVTEDLRPYMPADTSTDTQLSAFSDGNAAFYISGPWDLGTLRSADFELGVTTLPSLPDGGTPRPYAGFDLLYFSAAMDDNADAGAARDFTEWFVTNEQLQLEHATQGAYVPVNTTVAEGLPDDLQTFVEQLRTAYPMPANPKMEEVWGPFAEAIDGTFDGLGDLEENLQTAEESIRNAWSN